MMIIDLYIFITNTYKMWSHLEPKLGKDMANLIGSYLGLSKDEVQYNRDKVFGSCTPIYTSSPSSMIDISTLYVGHSPEQDMKKISVRRLEGSFIHMVRFKVLYKILRTDQMEIIISHQTIFLCTGGLSYIDNIDIDSNTINGHDVYIGNITDVINNCHPEYDDFFKLIPLPSYTLETSLG